MNTASTHEGVSNGLQAKCLGNEACYQFAKAHPKEYLFAANEVPDVEGATAEIEKYLKLGAVAIAEQKFGVECDSPEMQRIYQLAQAYHVPVLMHWQVGMYNYGFERFYKMLEKYPRVNFLGHAQTWWANVDKNYKDDPKNLYPKGPITPGGLTERYLSDYPNMYGDLSAGSGLNALTRDESFTSAISPAPPGQIDLRQRLQRSRRPRCKMSGRANHRRHPPLRAEQEDRAQAALREREEVVSALKLFVPVSTNVVTILVKIFVECFGSRVRIFEQSSTTIHTSAAIVVKQNPKIHCDNGASIMSNAM